MILSICGVPNSQHTDRVRCSQNVGGSGRIPALGPSVPVLALLGLLECNGESCRVGRRSRVSILELTAVGRRRDRSRVRMRRYLVFNGTALVRIRNPLSELQHEVRHAPRLPEADLRRLARSDLTVRDRSSGLAAGQPPARVGVAAGSSSRKCGASIRKTTNRFAPEVCEWAVQRSVAFRRRFMSA